MGEGDAAADGQCRHSQACRVCRALEEVVMEAAGVEAMTKRAIRVLHAVN